MEIPETRYAEAPDGTFIAFQVFGSGPVDVLLMPGHFTNLDENWRMQEIADIHRRIASFARVIAMDRRGVGLSDRMARGAAEPLETHVDDLIAVLDAAHANEVCLFSSESGASLALLFAAAHPERTRALALYMPIPYSAGHSHLSKEEWDAESLREARRWGDRAALDDLEEWAPTVAGDAATVRAWGAYLRSAASPGSAISISDQMWRSDTRGIYPAVQVPTLILERSQVVNASLFRPLVDGIVEGIAGSRLVDLPGRDVPYWWGDRVSVAGELEAFFVGTRSATRRDAHRGLATVLFTDIVGSTERAAALGDGAWTDVLERHNAIVRRSLDDHRGREIATTGDGFLATFDGPARAVRAGLEAVAAVRADLGIEIRAGAHTGEIEAQGDDVKGLAVHIAARVAARAGASELLATSTVKDLTAGSGLRFEDAGEHELKGVPGTWHLYRVT